MVDGRCLGPGKAAMFLNAEELAQRLGLAKSQIYRMTKRREIPVLRAGKHFRYDLEEVIEALRRKPVNQGEENYGYGREN